MAAALLSSVVPSDHGGALLCPTSNAELVHRRPLSGPFSPAETPPPLEHRCARRLLPSRAVQETKEAESATHSSPAAASSSSSPSSSGEVVTEKYDLEFGLWKIFSSKEEERGKGKSKTDQAKELLAKYRGAYLATSITLSLISFSLSYLLVSIGIDVQALLQKTLELWNMAENKSMAVQARDNLIADLAQSPVTGMVTSVNHDKLVKLWKLFFNSWSEMKHPE